MAIGEKVKVAGDRTATLTEARKRTNGPEKVYNFEVWREHNYFVGKEGVLVHNNYPIRSLQDAIDATRQIFEESFDDIKSLIHPQLGKVGYRGSLANGNKFNKVTKAHDLPFDPGEWDCDAFIVDDILADQIPIGNRGWRDLYDLNETFVTDLLNTMDKRFHMLEGFKPDERFTFRVYSREEFKNIKGKYTLIN